jgi:fibronectin type III domain protein
MNRNIAIVIGVLCIITLSGLSVTNMVKAATSVTLSTTGHTPNSITLSWTGSNDILFSSYKLYESSVGVNGPYTEIWSTSSKGTTSTYADGLSPDTSYYFYIVDSGTLVGSSNSNTLQATTTSDPTLSAISQTATTVSLQWYDNNIYTTLVPFDSYSVQMSSSGPNGPWSTLTTFNEPSQNTYAVTGLSAGTTYYFMLGDVFGSSVPGWIIDSNVVTVTLVAPTPTPTQAPTTPELTPLIALLAIAIATCSTILVKVVKQKPSKKP